MTAPIDGVVFDLRVSRGSLVERNAAEAPAAADSPGPTCKAKVYIPNDAIGFIQPEQRADISLTSFRASDYGYLPATVNGRIRCTHPR